MLVFALLQTGQRPVHKTPTEFGEFGEFGHSWCCRLGILCTLAATFSACTADTMLPAIDVPPQCVPGKNEVVVLNRHVVVDHGNGETTTLKRRTSSGDEDENEP